MSGFSWDVLLPWLYWPLAGYLLGWLAMALSARLAFGRAVRAGVHWTERARLTFPGARWCNTGPMFLALLLPVLWRNHLFDGTTAGRVLGLLTGLLVLFGGLQAAVSVSSQRRLPVTLREALRSFGISILFFAPSLVPGLAAAFYLGADADGARIAWTLGVAAAATLLLAAGGSYRLAHACGLIAPPDPRLLLIIQEAAARGGRMPQACGILHWKMINALAFPYSQAIVVTRDALDQMDDEELVLIVLHEMAHLTESRTVTWLRIASSLLLLPVYALGALAARYEIWGVLGPLLVMSVGGRLYRVLVRRMEQRADAAARTRQDQEGAYARTLEKLHRLNLIPAVLGPRDSAHPSLYDRMVAAGQAPFYPRPFPPSRSRVFWTLVTTAVLASAAAQLVPWGLDEWQALTYDEPAQVEEPGAPDEAAAEPTPPPPADDTVSPAEFDQILKQIR